MEVLASYPEDSGPRNFSWVVSDELAAMACPASLGELRTLAARGICHLVTLSEDALPPGITSNPYNPNSFRDISSSTSDTSTSRTLKSPELCSRDPRSPDLSSGRRSSLSSSVPNVSDMFDVTCRRAGPLNWLFLPVEEYCAPSIRQVVRFIEFCINCRQRGEPIAVHCRGGHGRTGALAACYLVYFQQLTPERAITSLRLTRPGSIETYRQERIVHEFRDLIRLESYESLVLSILREPHEDISLLYTQVTREKETKLRLNYFQREQIKKEMKVLGYNTVHCFLELLRKYIPFYPDLRPVY